MNYLKAALLIAFVAAMVYGVLLRSEMRGLEMRLKEAEAQVDRHQRELAGRNQEATANQAALTGRERYLRRVALARNQLETKLREIYATTDAASWGAVPCPDAIFDCLREPLSPGPANNAAGGLSSTGARATPRRPNQR